MKPEEAPVPEWGVQPKEKALVKPEGSTYAGARVVIGIHGECLKHLM